GIRDRTVTGVQTCALPILPSGSRSVNQAREFILLSSALIYGTGPGRQSLVAESYRARSAGDPISNQWRSLEEAAKRYLQAKTPRSEERRVGKECRSGGGAG